MKYTNNWSKSKERLRAFWNREILDRCCIWVTAPKDNASYKYYELPEKPEDKIKYWTDGEMVLERYKNIFENTYYAGDAFPILINDLGAAGHAGYFKNARFRFENTVWFFPIIHDWDEDELIFDENSFLYRKTIDLTRYYVSEAKGDFIVSMPDNCGNADALAHLRGSENLLMDMLLEPERVKAALEKIQAAWLRTNEEVYRIVCDNNDGGCSVGWLGTWAPGRHGQLQCDMSVMLSPEMFDQYIMDELRTQSSWMDYCLYHLDGVEQTRHLDKLLSVAGIHAIQWTNVAGQPRATEYLDVLRKIQAAGKGLIIHVEPHEVKVMLENLSSRGLYLLTWAETQRDADDLVRMAEKMTHE
ncbi:hypothetical protein [Clostridium thermosuccinogenes]|uniref:hypothetical protein n=1 Tax=Clostridium thermosuccinogenes TaxID=84032 RepID=UPI000CCC047C|nr:hypothetical protein [Pseudoclostridium thermosuccinogenes]PNT91073.1 hypothetical protein CDQ83_14730 [Pseudoclostridium thermosuccinogenes]